MGILLESLLVALLGLPLGIPWIAIPFLIVRLWVASAEDSAAEHIANAAPGDRGVLVEALFGVGIIGVAGALLLFALTGVGMGL